MFPSMIGIWINDYSVSLPVRGIRLCPYINVYFSIICYESRVSGFCVSLHDWPVIHESGGSCIAYTLS